MSSQKVFQFILFLLYSWKVIKSLSFRLIIIFVGGEKHVTVQETAPLILFTYSARLGLVLNHDPVCKEECGVKTGVEKEKRHAKKWMKAFDFVHIVTKKKFPGSNTGMGVQITCL